MTYWGSDINFGRTDLQAATATRTGSTMLAPGEKPEARQYRSQAKNSRNTLHAKAFNDEAERRMVKRNCLLTSA
jgi:hypothetical protein